MAKSSTDTVTYFVAKCISMDSLKRSARNSIWACCDRKTPPQPRDLLTQGGDVILLFSVNNCHGWHGYAQVSSPPGSVTEEEFNATLQPNETLTLTKDKSKDGDPVWHRFRIEWKILYLKEHGEQCLPFTETEELVCCDGQPVNKARNFQEVSPETGEIMCQKMDLHLAYLTSTRQKKLEERQQKLPPPFFQPGTENDPKRVWDKLVHKVSNMGKVLLACAFGSQRYNLHTPESDVDMFVVYAADTKDFLGFSPPQHTIKNKDTELCDYTVHEVHRYCELLIAGDHRCVETLYLHPSSIYCASDEWRELCGKKKLFLTKQCAEKYMRDALGSKGTRLLDKWVESGEALQSPMPKSVAKLFYIVFRLLQNVRGVLQGDNLIVFREDGSKEKELLMGIRSSQFSYPELQEQLDQLLREIECLKADKEETDLQTTSVVVENWLMKLRYENLKTYMEHKTDANI